MQIDIKTNNVEPIRATFSHVARRLGTDKPASRYQEATFDIQPERGWHYRPLWDQEHELYDPRRTAVVMADWYAFKDPRQLYYGTWTINRSRQQDSAERNFSFVEKREMLDDLPAELREQVAHVMVPLRHVEYAANLNNMYVTGYGFGTAVTQTTAFAAMDRLGIAQYLTRIGLILDGNSAEVLDSAKAAWMDDPAWQPMRRLVENMLTTEDWFELYVAQNFALDGLLYPLIYDRFDKAVSAKGGSAVAMLTEFMVDWFAENNRCVDAFLKTAAAESDANRDLISGWARSWSARAAEALKPIAEKALGDDATTAIAELHTALVQRGAKKSGLDI